MEEVKNPFENVIEEEIKDENGNLVGINRKYPDVEIVVVNAEETDGE